MSGVIAGRAISGIGAAGCRAIGIVLAASSFPTSVQTRYIAALEVSQAVGFIFGPLIGGAFAQARSWVSRDTLALEEALSNITDSDGYSSSTFPSLSWRAL